MKAFGIIFICLAIGLFVMLAIAYAAIELIGRWQLRRRKRHG